MQRLLYTFTFLLFVFSSLSQTSVFHENFETVDSVTTSGNPLWVQNGTYQSEGNFSYHGTLAVGDTSYATSDVFSATGNSFVTLSFSHICKIEFFDGAIVEVSTDNGSTWTKLTQNEYLGQGNFGTQGDEFSSVSYPEWLPGDNTAAPDNATWWRTEVFDISSLAANAAQVQVRFTLFDGNNTGSAGNYGWLLDDVQVLASPSELIPPVITPVAPIYNGTVYSTGPFNITAEITDDLGIDTAYVTFTVNNGSSFSVPMVNTGGDIFEGEIPSVNPNDTVCYYITAVDSSPAQNIATEPTNGCTEFISTPGIALTYFDNFDSDTLWTDSTIDAQTSWELGTPNFGATNSAHSNPNAWDINLNAAYTNNAEAYLTSPVFDFATAVNVTMSFWLNWDCQNSLDGMHMEYSTDLTNWQTLGTENDPLGVNWYNDNFISGTGEPGWTNTSNGWIKAEYDLAFLDNETGPVQFRFVFATSGSTVGDGFSVDDFALRLPQPIDVGIIGFEEPNEGSCGLSTSENVSVLVKNFGLDPQDTVPVAFTIDNGTPVIDTLFANIQPGDTATFTFASTVDLSTPGQTYTFDAWTDLETDSSFFNDTLFDYQISNNLVLPAWIEDFETFGTGTPGTMDNGWVQDSTDGFDWTVQTGGTSSSNTGPTGDHTTGSGIYLYTEASTNNSDTAILISPCIDLTALTQPKLDFWYHMFGGDMGTLFVDVLDVNSGNWINAWSLSGDQGDEWIQATVDISAGAGTVTRIRFRGVTGPSFESDISIDDIYIYEPQPEDVGVTQFISPVVAGCGLSANEPITVEVVNFGLNTQDTIPLAYSIDGGGAVVDTLFQTLNPGDTTQFTFAIGGDLSTSGQTYVLASWSELNGDLTVINDSATGYQITHFQQVSTFPYLEDYETFTPGSPGTFANLWEADPATGYRWQVNDGGTSSIGTGPEVDHTLGTATGIYVYAEASSGSQGDIATLTSPCIDLASISNPFMSFWYHMAGDEIGKLYLDVFDGTAWVNAVDSIIGTQQLDINDPWEQFNTSLLDYAGESIKLRFRAERGVGFEGDIAIDDLRIYEPFQYDAGVIEVLTPNPIMTSQIDVYPEVVIKNFGWDTLTTFDVAYQIDGGTPTVETFNGTLFPNGVDTFTFATPFVAPQSTFEFCSYTDLTNDGDNTNDTTCLDATGMAVIEPQYVTDFDTVDVFLSSGGFDQWEKGVPAGSVINSSWSPVNSWMTDLDADYQNNSNDNLYSPFFDFSNTIDAELSFRHYMHSQANIDGGRVEYTNDGGDTWQVLGDVNDPNSTNWYTDDVLSASGLPAWEGIFSGWLLSTYDLSFLNNNNSGLVQFRFNFASNASSNSFDGWAVDDFRINVPITLTAATKNPSTAIPLILPGAVTVSTEIENRGTTPLSSTDVTLEVDGNVIVTDNRSFSPALALNQTEPHTFSQTWTASPGLHTIKVYTSNPNSSTDLFFPDDTTTLEVTVFDTTSVFPYCNDFENVNQSRWVTLNSFDYSYTGSDWEIGTPAQSTINSANDGNNAWMVDLNGNYQARDSSSLFTPAFGVNNQNCYEVSFWHNYETERYEDGGTVEYSTDQGATWSTIGDQPAQDWYDTWFITGLDGNPPAAGWSGSSSGWIEAKSLVKFDDPGQVIFRFRFGSDASLQDEGWAVDDFCFEQVAPCNIGLEEIAENGMSLGQNIPNPSSGMTQINYSIPSRGEVNFEVRSLLGQLVYSNAMEMPQGNHQMEIDLGGNAGGVYYYSIEFGGERLTKKMMLTK